MNTAVHKNRIKKLNKDETRQGPVIYWMSRDQRVQDNWALLFARELSDQLNTSLAVVFCLVPEYSGAGFRQYDFMLQGLIEVEKDLNDLNYPFFLLRGDVTSNISSFAQKVNAGALVADFSPLRIKRTWDKSLAEKLKCPLYEVDAHNVVPCRAVSNKREYAAYTIRPKINAVLSEYLTDIPELKPQSIKWSAADWNPVDWQTAYTVLNVDRNVEPVKWLKPGSESAKVKFAEFTDDKLVSYADNRNDPALDAQSNLSPFIHFGQISAQRIAYEVSQNKDTENNDSAEDFLEELIVRRELSDNFCFYEPLYDALLAIPDWARKTLDEHRSDERDYIYKLENFERADTHDDLWNAAQMEMVKKGKMHGYMRMYWVKKILEWTEKPEDALQIAIYLNDKYELDGRDPNGYCGILWGIGGVHDRAWAERPVYGKIRYMNYNGCKSKFDVDAYLRYSHSL